ncbi:CMRF35-like molecule 8 [Channa argus]|uniref:CMRF35-like molecule 8 n=1 Tax=Channa argus TaxID=215402 RepID=UPI003521721F
MMNRMRSSLLLILSLLTGCEASSKVKGCTDGLAIFTCKCHKSGQKSCDQKTTMQSTVDACRRFLNPDTKDDLLSLYIKQFEQGPNAKKQKLKVEADVCLEPFTHTTYNTAKTSIVCNKSGNEHSIMFFCKEKKSICEDVLSTKSKGRFTLTNNNRSISIRDVSLDDNGDYWCGVRSYKEKYNVALRKIQLKVEKIIKFTRSPTVGQDFTYWCNYSINTFSEKFICKGEDPSLCRTVVTTQNKGLHDRFSLKDDTKKKNLTITLREVTAEDSGTYWCGGESAEPKSSKTFLHRFVMTVVAPRTSPVSSTTQTTSAASPGNGLKSQGVGSSVIIVVVCVTLLLLLIVLILIIFYKRFSSSKNTNTGAAQKNNEDYIYEDIQEHLHQPDLDNVLTIYATANFPMDPSASMCYSVIGFKNADDETSALRPSSTHCEYSNVKYSCRVSAEEPLYSTVNHPQQEPGNIRPDGN